MNDKQHELILSTACDMGKIMLQSGAEVYRVEETIIFYCLAYGLEGVQCSVTPYLITLGFRDKEKSTTIVVVAKDQKLNLQKVALIIDLCRSINKAQMPVEIFAQKLEEISSLKPYSDWKTALAAGIGTGAFAVVFGGTATDFLCGLIIGAILRLLMIVMSRYGFQDIFSRFVGGAVASFLGILIYRGGFGSSVEILTVSGLTLLFPGLLFTNSLRDIATGDFLSAVTHATESLSSAAALAVGAALVQGMMNNFGGIIL